MEDIAIITSNWYAGVGHGSFAGNLIPRVLKLGSEKGLKVKIEEVKPLFEIRTGKGMVGGYITIWPVRFLKHPRAKIVHALDASVATQNTSILTLHDVAPLAFPMDYLKSLSAKLEWKYRKHMFLKAKKILSNSEFSKQECIKYIGVNPDKIEVCPHAITDDFYPVSMRSRFYREGKINIMTACQTDPRKNLPTLVRAVGILKEKGYDVNFVRFGPSTWAEETKKIEAVANEYGLEIVEPGVVSIEELRAAYSSFDVFVWPTIYEGMGLPPLEALACGNRVVALDLPFNREFMKDVPVYVKNEPREIAEGILEALKTKIEERGIKLAKNYTWERCAQHHIKVYQELLDR
ncbi:MAG: glycosyltransferase family 4 protein [Thermoplasmata archaeon]